MDRNQLIGLLLILAMFVGYQYLVPKPPPEKKPAQITKTTKPAPGSTTAVAAPLDSAAARRNADPSQFGAFAQAAAGQARDIVVENPEVKVTFTTQGGRVKEVLLKKYKTFDGKPLLLVDAKTSRTTLELPTATGRVDLHGLYYQTTAQGGTVTGQPQVVTFRADAGNGQAIEQSYTIPATGYTVDYSLKASGLNNVPANGEVRLLWEDRMPQFENDLKNNRVAATINYLTTKDNFDHLPENESSNEAIVEDPVKWFAIKHKYFLSAFIAQTTQLTKAKFQTVVDLADSSTVKTAVADVSFPLAAVKAGKGQFRYYYGPNDFQVIKAGIAPDFDQNVYLGYSILKPINKYFFVPVFNFLEKFIGNYGLLIFCLVVFVKLLLTPLTYKSYISMAKMRVLAPELAVIKERVGDDMTKQQQEQMKLYQEVGVSPLSGCIPVLATMPILFALFQLFPNLIELRQKTFLWAPDLSTYDSFIKFGVNIPFVGDHLSLFTVMMTISSIAYAYYNNQTTPQQPGPVNMKALSYIFPVMFMFVLNSFPAGLTWYYFVSNVVTIAQQLLIRNFVDETKLKSMLDDNRKKIAAGGGKKSKFQEMLQKQLAAAEDARKQADDAKKRAKK